VGVIPLPWKRCPECQGLSYTAATNYSSWVCPYCNEDMTRSPELPPDDEEVRIRIHGQTGSAGMPENVTPDTGDPGEQ
jgi:hypothetical protein